MKRFASLLILLGLAGCATSPAPEKKSPTVRNPVKQATSKSTVKLHKVALLVPLSGAHSDAGQALEQAAELSLFNQTDSSIELLIRDTRGTAEGARQAASDAIQEGATLVLGPLLSHEVTAIKTTIPTQIPVLAFSNNQAVAGPNVFILGHTPTGQVERIGRYAAAHGIYNIAVFSPQNEYGNLVADVFKSLQTQGILQIAADVRYKNLSSLAPLTAKSIQGLFFAEGGTQLKPLLEALQAQGVRLAEFKLLGSAQWNHPDILNNPKLAGALFVDSDPFGYKVFEQRYEQTYGSKPPRIASLAYDAVSLVTALTKLNKDHPFTISNLLQKQGFIGVDGIFRLQSQGTVERGLAIHEVTGNGSRVIDPAPRKF